MRFDLAIIVLSSLLASTSTAEGDPATPSQKYAALLKEYSPASYGIRGVKSDLERKQAVDRQGAFASRFIKLASEHPQDPVALKALRQAAQIVVSHDSAAINSWELSRAHFPAGSRDGSAKRLVDLILRDHLQSDSIGPVVDRMRYGYQMEFDRGLSALLARNPHHQVQGLSCLALAQFLNDRLRMLLLVDDRPELSECCEVVFGKNYLPDLRSLGRVKLQIRIESLFERAAEQYADVKLRATTVGRIAERELRAIRQLAVGKTAPEMEGQDQLGKSFRLSDYRGKVVLLYFWSEY